MTSGVPNARSGHGRAAHSRPGNRSCRPGRQRATADRVSQRPDQRGAGDGWDGRGDGRHPTDVCWMDAGFRRSRPRDAGRNPREAFEAFFTTKHRGTGLGLQTARRIVETHGGEIAIDAVEGGGTVVSISLPADRQRFTGDGKYRSGWPVDCRAWWCGGGSRAPALGTCGGPRAPALRGSGPSRCSEGSGASAGQCGRSG